MKYLSLFVFVICFVCGVSAQNRKLLPVSFKSEYDVLMFRYDSKNRISEFYQEEESNSYILAIKYSPDGKEYELILRENDKEKDKVTYKNISDDGDRLVFVPGIDLEENMFTDTLIIENQGKKFISKGENSDIDYFFELDENGNMKHFAMPNTEDVTSEYISLFMQILKLMNFTYDDKNGIFKEVNKESLKIIPPIMGMYFSPLLHLHNNVTALSLTPEALKKAEKIGVIFMGLNNTDDVRFTYEYNEDNYPITVFVNGNYELSIEYEEVK